MDATAHIESPASVPSQANEANPKPSKSRRRRLTRRRRVSKAEVAFVDHFAAVLAKSDHRLR
jgi:hypothetical protein